MVITLASNTVVASDVASDYVWMKDSSVVRLREIVTADGVAQRQ